MDRRLLTITGISLVISMVYTSHDVMATEPTFASRQIARAHQLIEMWLECIECDQGELKGVATLGALVTPSLIATLKAGPSQAKREIMRLHLKGSYKRLTEYKHTHHANAPTESESEYVAHYLNNYHAQYQIRAAIALAEIGGPTAKQAIEEALATPLRKDVEHVLKELKEKLGKPSP